MGLIDRIQHSWNAFKSLESTAPYSSGVASSAPSHRRNYSSYNRSDFANSIFNRIAIDASQVDLMHVKVDFATENQEVVNSPIQNCLSLEANIDQSHRDFMQDVVQSLFDEGVVAIVPIETSQAPNENGTYDIYSMRVGRITQWYPKHVRVKLYNEEKGVEEEVTVEKRTCAIVENPLYETINSKNGTLKRLLAKMALLDGEDERVSTGKLDLILQLPGQIKSPVKQQQAESRIKSLEAQLATNAMGVAYIDGTEKVTQLNRPVSNSLVDQIEKLKVDLFNQLGLTMNVFSGTASEGEMRNYYSRTIDPIIDKIVNEFRRKFLTKTARSQGHTFVYYRDPFKLVPIEQIGSLGDSLTRNAILTPNEVRKTIGFKPSNDPDADKLFNRNISDKNQATAGSGSVASPDDSQNGNKSTEGGETV